MKSVALVGTGNVGRQVYAQLQVQPTVNIVALCNSTKMLVCSEGQAAIGDLERDGVPADIPALLSFLAQIAASGGNPVLVDCTASLAFPDCYKACVGLGASVVAANKTIFERPWSDVSVLMGNERFAYEATCGAGLPVIATIKGLLAAGDEVKRVEGLLSGTLAYVFSEVERGVKFSEAVLNAKEKGYTEPDPRDDLSGKDVQRKLMVLARSLGLSFDIEHVSVGSLVPAHCQAIPLASFLSTELPALDPQFESMRQEADKSGAVLRFVAEISAETMTAAVGVKAVDKASMLAAAHGTDNVFHIVTKRYPRGMTIVGAGAGAEVTAMGVVTDILGLKAKVS